MFKRLQSVYHFLDVIEDHHFFQFCIGRKLFTLCLEITSKLGLVTHTNLIMSDLSGHRSNKLNIWHGRDEAHHLLQNAAKHSNVGRN